MKGLKILGALLALALVFSCAKKETAESGEQGGVLKYFTPEIGSSYQQEPLRSTVSIATGAIVFQDGDRVMLTDGRQQVAFRYKSSDNRFYSEGNFSLSGSAISAIYPADIVTGKTVEGNFRISLPEVQSYFPGVVYHAPMGGRYAAGKVSFNPLCTLVDFPISGKGSLSKVVFKAASVPVCGSGEATASSLTLESTSSRELRLDTSDASLENEGYYVMVLPSQTYTNGFTLTMTKSDGVVANYEVKNTVTLSPGRISLSDAVDCSRFSGGEGTEDDPFRISSAADLMQLRDLIDSDEYENFTDKYYLQTADIDYNGGTIRTISTEKDQEFKGTYDGGGFSILNAKFTRSYDRVAFFGGCAGATIKHLNFKNCSVTQAKRGAAFVAGWAQNVTIEDCHVTGGSVVSKWTAAGSIVGEGKGITVRNCSSNATITSSNATTYSGAGGIVGYLDGDPSTISNCEFSGTVSVNNEASTEVAAARAGGIVGSCGGSVVENCTFKGTVTCVGSQVGGIVGNSEAPANNPGIIRSCTVSGASISAGDWGCAGIIARNYGMNVQQCQVSSSTITSADNNAAGIVGINKYNLRVSDCTVSSSFIESTAGTKAGGIIAEMGNAGADYHAYVTGCIVTGSTVKSKYYTGGVAGFISQGNVIDRCFVSSTNVTSTAGGEAGGIVGKTAANGIVIINCMYWGGTVQGATVSSGIGGIVGSFHSDRTMSSGQTVSTTVVVNCMANPTKLLNVGTATGSANLGGVAGYMAYTKMNNSYSPIASSNVTFSGTDSDDKRGSLFGSLNFGGEVLNGYYLTTFKQGYSYSGSTYTLKTQGARDSQMQQNDATSNVFWVPSIYPDGDYRQADMTAALNKGADLYNAASPLYGVTAKTWVKTSSYAYPVLAGSPLDGGSSPSASIRVGIIGDSISTFQGYSGGSYQYPKSEYEAFTVQDTWWHQLIYTKMSGACLDINTSNCGSTVQKHASKGQPSFLDRYSKLVSPSVILINGGTNDSWSYRLPLGTLDFSLPLQSLDEYQFAQAYDKLIRLCRRDYPDAAIYPMIGDCLRDFPTYAQVIKDVAAHYSLHYVEINFGDRRSALTYQRTGTSDVNVHPNKAGMTEMATQAWNQLSAWI